MNSKEVELYLIILTKRIDAQDEVLKNLVKTVEILHEYNKVRDGHKG